MSAVMKAIKCSAGMAAVGLTVYGLSRMLKRKAETGQMYIDRYLTEPREPGDYRSIYNL